MNFDENSDFADDNRMVLSDFVDLLFVEELFKDEDRFEAMVLHKEKNTKEIKIENLEEEEVMIMGMVRFNSTPNLPS